MLMPECGSATTRRRRAGVWRIDRSLEQRASQQGEPVMCKSRRVGHALVFGNLSMVTYCLLMGKLCTEVARV